MIRVHTAGQRLSLWIACVAVRLIAAPPAAKKWSEAMPSDPVLVLVKWLDSYGCSSEWQPIKDINAPAMVCSSVGWLVHEGEDSIVVVPHMSPPDHAHAEWQGCGDMTIPRVAVVEITELGKGKARQ